MDAGTESHARLGTPGPEPLRQHGNRPDGTPERPNGTASAGPRKVGRPARTLNTDQLRLARRGRDGSGTRTTTQLRLRSGTPEGHLNARPRVASATTGRTGWTSSASGTASAASRAAAPARQRTRWLRLDGSSTEGVPTAGFGFGRRVRKASGKVERLARNGPGPAPCKRKPSPREAPPASAGRDDTETPEHRTTLASARSTERTGWSGREADSLGCRHRPA